MENRLGKAWNLNLLDRQMETIYQVNWLISSIQNMDQLLTPVMRESEMAVNAEASSIALYDADEDLLHIEFARGDVGLEVQSLPVAMGQGVLGSVASDRDTLRIADVASDPRFDTTVDQKTGFGTKSLLATPIQWQGKLLGVLEVINKRDGSPFSENDER